MAQVQYGSNVTGLKGSLGGHVFQGGNGGQIVRQKMGKSQPKTSQYGFSLQVFRFVVSQWNSLSVEQKNLWNTYASSYPAKDRFGNSIVISGYAYYMAVHKFLLANGDEYTIPPGEFYMPNDYILNNIDSSPSDHILNINTDSWIGPYQRLRVFISQQFDGNSFAKPTKWRMLNSVEMEEGVPYNMYPDLASIFGWSNTPAYCFYARAVVYNPNAAGFRDLGYLRYIVSI
jgi:hypothetical protein